MGMDERKLKILQAIINDFIRHAEPVGSRSIAKNYNLGIGAATVRNEMSDLEEQGYLKQPHTSAGRVPSDKAYRLYVDSIMDKYVLDQKQKGQIKEKLTSNLNELDRTIEKASNILSEITNLTAFAVTPKVDENILKYIKLILVDEHTVMMMIVTEDGKINNTVLKTKELLVEKNLEMLSKVMTFNYRGKTLSSIIKSDMIKDFEEDVEVMHKVTNSMMPNILETFEKMLDSNLYMNGLANIFSLPEFNDIDKAKDFIQVMDHKEHISNAIATRAEGVDITIGHENADIAFQDCSLVTATYSVKGKPVGQIGVIGPTRMKYNQISAVLECMATAIGDVFSEDEEE